MIAAGEKKEEYREIKNYWLRRLADGFTSKMIDGRRIYIFEGMYRPKHYDIVRFRNGYAANAPTMDVELKGIEFGFAKEAWAGGFKDQCFILKLGRVLSVENGG